VIETSPSIENLAAALGKFQAETRGVVKDAANPFFKSRYATLEAVIETARPGLATVGLAFLQAPKGQVGMTVELETMLMHGSSGEWLRFATVMPLPKADPQGVGSAITYAARYALMAMLGLPPLDDDAEATKPQPKQPRGEYIEGPPRKRDPIEGYHPPGGRAAPPPTDDSRAYYLKESLKIIANITDEAKLNKWLDVEAEKVWPDFGITMHDDDGRAILMA
jgi:hypothetical protein